MARVLSDERARVLGLSDKAFVDEFSFHTDLDVGNNNQLKIDGARLSLDRHMLGQIANAVRLSQGGVSKLDIALTVSDVTASDIRLPNVSRFLGIVSQLKNLHTISTAYSNRGNASVGYACSGSYCKVDHVYLD